MRLLLSVTLALLSISSVHAELKTIYVTPQAEQKTLPAAAQVKTIKKGKKARLPKESALNFLEPVLGIENVKPWHKSTLAKDEMKPGGRMPTMNKFGTKVFASKENTRGGTGIGGGGCGWN